MNFDTPPQALTICGEWNKIFEDTRHKRQAAPDCLFARAYPARPGGAARRAGNVPAEGEGNTAQFPPNGSSTAPAAAARHLRCQNAR